jgi:hypothetical protein
MVNGSVEVTKSAWRRALKETWSAVGWHLFNQFVQKHFTKAGAAEYRAENVAYGEVAADDTYRPRGGEGESGKAFWKSYNGRKQKSLGHQLAMVFSGRTRDGAKRPSIQATFHGVAIRLPGVVHINQYKPRAKKHGPHAGEPPINLRGDLLAISRREQEELRALHERILIERFGQKWLENYIVHIGA